MKFKLPAACALILAVFAGSASAQQKAISIVLTQPPIDTGIKFTKGQLITVTASGKMNWFTGGCPASGQCITTPDGYPWSACENDGGFYAPGLACWSLIGQIGPNGTPFQVGSSFSMPAASSGDLFLGVNDNYYPDNTGNWTAVIAQPGAISLVDPVPDSRPGAAQWLGLLSGAQITTALTASSGQPYLADFSRARPVLGLATDGVAQVVVRIPASSVGETITVDFAPNQCPTPGSPQCIDEYGLLFDPTNPPGAAMLFSDSAGQNPVAVQAVSTASGPMAFVAYRAPIDFVRSGNATDPAIAQRSVSITVNGQPVSQSIVLVRPPVVLIHGTFSDPSVFNNFLPITTSTVIFHTTLDYSKDIDSQVTGTFPSYTSTRKYSPFSSHVKQNVIGVAYNAPLLLNTMVTRKIENFKADSPAPVNIPVAAVQADVVAHSLGGLMARGMAHVGTDFVGTPIFYGDASYGQGYIHKLITLGTPHLGTNLALRTVNGDKVPGDPTVGDLFPSVGGNDCTRNSAAFFGEYSLNSATINGTVYPGAAFDQLGDPTQAIVSPTITLLNKPRALMIPTAFIAAYFTSANNDPEIAAHGQIAETFCGSETEFVPPDDEPYFVPGVQPCGDIYCLVIHGDFLADNYSFSGWPNIFNTQSSDVVVPFASARFNQTVYSSFPNVVHGPGTVGAGPHSDPHIGFAGPQLLDPASLAPAMVLQLLNTSVTDTLNFVKIP